MDAAVKWLKGLPKKLKVADFGCGDASLAKAVQQKVASLDLVAAAPGVIACNMSATPLGDFLLLTLDIAFAKLFVCRVKYSLCSSLTNARAALH